MIKLELKSNYDKILARLDPAEYKDVVELSVKNVEEFGIEYPKLDSNMDAKLAY